MSEYLVSANLSAQGALVYWRLVYKRRSCLHAPAQKNITVLVISYIIYS